MKCTCCCCPKEYTIFDPIRNEIAIEREAHNNMQTYGFKRANKRTK